MLFRKFFDKLGDDEGAGLGEYIVIMGLLRVCLLLQWTDNEYKLSGGLNSYRTIRMTNKTRKSLCTVL